jgi:two-component system response regulator MprA
VESPGDPLAYAAIRIEPEGRQAWYGDRRLELTQTEFDLLTFLVGNPERVHSRQTIMDRVWGFDLGAASNTLAVYIGYLRRKLEAAGAPPLIQTVRGLGYVLREP